MIDLIGIGMGSRECLTLEALHTIARADCLIGAGRLVDCFPDLPAQKERCLPSQIVPFIKEHPEFENVAVLLSGDAGFYSAATKLRGELGERESRTICGISSLQYFCARLGIPWQDVAVLSLHGREGHLLGTVAKNRRTFLLAGGELTAEKIWHPGLPGCGGAARPYRRAALLSRRADQLGERAGAGGGGVRPA